VRADESAPACYQYSHEIKPNYRTDLQYGAGVGPSVREGPIRLIAEVVKNVRFIVLANFRLQRTRRLGFSFILARYRLCPWSGHLGPDVKTKSILCVGGYSTNARYAGIVNVQRLSNRSW
jgi:hypothetical protein